MENNIIDSDITLEHSTPGEKSIQENLNYYYNDVELIEHRLVDLDD